MYTIACYAYVYIVNSFRAREYWKVGVGPIDRPISEQVYWAALTLGDVFAVSGALSPFSDEIPLQWVPLSFAPFVMFGYEVWLRYMQILPVRLSKCLVWLYITSLFVAPILVVA